MDPSSAAGGGGQQASAPGPAVGGSTERLENLLEGTVETLRQLAIIVEDNHPNQPPTFLFDKMYSRHSRLSLPSSL